MRIVTEHQRLMNDFAAFLTESGTTFSTSGTYRAEVSAAINKQLKGYSDSEGLIAHVAEMERTAPSRARVFLAAWGYFRRFMQERNVEVVVLASSGRPAGQVPLKPPADAIFGLRQYLNMLTVTEFTDLRWGYLEVDPDAVRLYFLRNNGKTIRVAMPRDVIPLLDRLRAWGVRSGVCEATTLVMPVAPDTATPLSTRQMTYLLGQETQRRIRAAPPPPLTPPAMPVALPPSSPSTSPDVMSVAVSTVPQEEMFQLHAAWCQLAPCDPPLDRIYVHAFRLINTTDEVTRARWRRVRWENGLENDYGPSPFPTPPVIPQLPMVPPVLPAPVPSSVEKTDDGMENENG